MQNAKLDQWLWHFAFRIAYATRMASDLRPAAVAGTWYPASADRLGRDVDACVARAEIGELPALKAIVAPHAGLTYSGPVAAFAYKAASRTQYRSAVLVGPSHFVGF